MSAVTQAVLLALKKSGPSTVALTATAVATTDGSSYSFASVSLGTPRPDRYLIVAAAAKTGSSRTIAGCTVVGASTTLLVHKSTANADAAIFITNAVNATDSTGTIVLTSSSGNLQNMAISVYEASGLNSNAADGTPQTTATSGATMSLPVSAGGSAVGVAVAGAGSAPNFAWSGLTEDADTLIETANGMAGVASAFSATAQTLSVICIGTTSTDFNACCVALR